MFKVLLYQPLLKVLAILTQVLGGSLGLAIIVLTALIRTALIPLTLPATRSAQKLKDLKPHLDELKRRHGSDRRRLQEEQMNLYRQHGVNPAAGCLPTIVQFAILIALYQVFIDFINRNGTDGQLAADLQFLWLDLAKPDPIYILPILAGVTQLILSLMLMTAKEHHEPADLKPAAAKKEETKREDTKEMAETLQQQMLYVMPVMTALIALRLPSGLAVYWITTTVYSLIQQYLTSGLGGLAPALAKLTGKIYGRPSESR